jgi:hypothetical protein
MVPPHVLLYDLCILSIAVGFLVKEGLSRGFASSAAVRSIRPERKEYEDAANDRGYDLCCLGPPDLSFFEGDSPRYRSISASPMRLDMTFAFCRSQSRSS